MKALIALDGYRVEAVLDEAARLLVPEADWLILHVADTRPLEEVDRALQGLPGRGPGKHRARHQLRHVQEWDEETVRAAIDAWLRRAGRSAPVLAARGRPEREIIRVAEEEAVDLLVLGGGRGLPGRYPGPGPYPLSPVARFVIDHARCDVLLLRRYVMEEDRR